MIKNLCFFKDSMNYLLNRSPSLKHLNESLFSSSNTFEEGIFLILFFF